jgi:hypothetical protein
VTLLPQKLRHFYFNGRRGDDDVVDSPVDPYPLSRPWAAGGVPTHRFVDVGTDIRHSMGACYRNQANRIAPSHQRFWPPAGFPERMYTCGIRASSRALTENAIICLIFQ